jgi:hypothetical protein
MYRPLREWYILPELSAETAMSRKPRRSYPEREDFDKSNDGEGTNGKIPWRLPIFRITGLR